MKYVNIDARYEDTRLDCLSSRHQTALLRLRGPWTPQTQGWWSASPSCASASSRSRPAASRSSSCRTSWSWGRRGPWSPWPLSSTPHRTRTPDGRSYTFWFVSPNILDFNDKTLENVPICHTSGMVISPLQTLLTPPWKATLNIVFFANLEWGNYWETARKNNFMIVTMWSKCDKSSKCLRYWIPRWWG